MDLEILEVLEVEHFLIYLLVELEVSPSSQLVRIRDHHESETI